MRRRVHTTPVGRDSVPLLVRLMAIRPLTPNALCTSRTSYLSLHSSEVSDKALQTHGIELKIKNTHIQNKNVEWGKYFPAVKDESVMQKSKIRRWRGFQINKVRLAFNQLLPERWYLFLLIPVIGEGTLWKISCDRRLRRYSHDKLPFCDVRAPFHSFYSAPPETALGSFETIPATLASVEMVCSLPLPRTWTSDLSLSFQLVL